MRTTLAIVILVLTGCAGGGRATGPSGPAEPSTGADSVRAETFDISPYRDEPADVRVDVEHDVPEALMENRADAGVDRIVSGFRVQIFSTLDQEEAAMNQEAAQAWWARMVEQGDVPVGIPTELQVYRLFRQPYYRIRVGDFVDRSVADSVATLFGRRFEGSFVVPDQVTVRR